MMNSAMIVLMPLAAARSSCWSNSSQSYSPGATSMADQRNQWRKMFMPSSLAGLESRSQSPRGGVDLRKDTPPFGNAGRLVEGAIGLRPSVAEPNGPRARGLKPPSTIGAWLRHAGVWKLGPIPRWSRSDHPPVDVDFSPRTPYSKYQVAGLAGAGV